MKEFRQFSAADIRKKISMRVAIDLMRDAFVQLSNGDAQVPVRTVVDAKGTSGRVLFMPSYSVGYGLFGIKMVSVFDHNSKLNLPMIQGMMMVMDGATGRPAALLEAEYLTALRTGAASGLATELLARKDSRVLAIFGCGAQAETQLEGVITVRAIEETIVFGTTEQKTALFCKRMTEKFGIEIRPGDHKKLPKADIICTATTSLSPLFQLEDLNAGVHINAIGAYTPSMQEIPMSSSR